MTVKPKSRINWFDQGGSNYALFRPEYPPALAAYLASISPERGRALDVGCGTGQLAVRLATHFGSVIGLDLSLEQLKNAPGHERVSYLCSWAESIPLKDGCAHLIAAAQAAHWFDLPVFYAQARRLAAPNAVIALLSYGVLKLDEDTLNDRFAGFYHDEIGPYWPPERRLVDNGYADIDMPFEELEPPVLAIECGWKLQEFLGYISTWSAFRRAVEAGREEIVSAFVDDLSQLWGSEERVRSMTWPINMRIGRI